MMMYYYARKLQKGAKVSAPSSSSGGSRSVQREVGSTRGNCSNQQIPPLPIPLVRGNKQNPQHQQPQISHHHCCQSPCCPISTLPQCSYHNCQNQSQNQCHSHVQCQEHIKMNGELPFDAPHHYHCGIKDQDNVCRTSSKQPQPLLHNQHPPCCAMLQRSESKYENIQDFDGNEYEFNASGSGDIGKDQEDRTRTGSHLGIRRNSHSPPVSTLQVQACCEGYFYDSREGNVDEEDSKIQQEIYYGKQVSKGSLSSLSENYIRENSPKKNRKQQVGSENSTPKFIPPAPSLCYKKGQLVSGSWDALLEKVVIPCEDAFPDEEALYAFLLCSRLHTSPHLTMEAVFKHFSVQPNANFTSNETQQREEGYEEDEDESDYKDELEYQNTPNNEDQERPSASGFLNDDDIITSTTTSPKAVAEEELNLQKEKVHLLVKFIRIWTELLPHDFRDDRLMQFVRLITRVCSNELRQEVLALCSKLTSRLAALEAFDAALKRYKTESSIGEPIASPSVVTICPSALTMAEQLSLVELEHLSCIGAQELVAQLLRKDRSRAKPSDHSRLNGSLPSSRTGTLVKCATIAAPTCYTASGLTLSRSENSTASNTAIEAETDTQNLDAFIQWFRRLAMFVASEICKMEKKKSRCRVIEYWIQVGKECLKIRNFNSLMAILAGLSCRPVARLKKTWNKINCADLIDLQTAMDPKTNFACYRSLYKASVWNSIRLPALDTHNYRILVPYFALLLKDVYNLNSLYPSNAIKFNDHINFEKYTNMTKLIREIMSWQAVSCTFDKIPSIYNAVQALPIYTEEEVTSASYGCEEPDGCVEKEHFNRLRRDHHSNKFTHLFSKSNSNSPIHYLI